MAIDVYKECINPITGETFKGLTLTPYAYTMQWTAQPGGYLPIEHLHCNQDQIFYVKKGQLKVLIEGKEHIAGPGENVVVTKGKRHLAFNNQDTVLETHIELRPALDQEKLMQCFTGLIKDGHIDENGAPRMSMLSYMLRKMKCKAMIRPTNVPASMFKLSLNISLVIGGMKGWDKLYQKYTR